MRSKLFIATALTLMAAGATGAELVLRTSTEQVGLLELYTSEGCSSCPAADSWLSELKDEQGLWSEFVPLAFHVDYWDYIGWKDRFAAPAYSARQRDYARRGAISTVYTPGFVFNGKEWRAWFGGDTRRFPNGDRPGVLELALDEGNARISFRPQGEGSGALDVTVALLGFGITTKVGAGENSGRRLGHDFVVLGAERHALAVSDDTYTATASLPSAPALAARTAVAAWVSNKGELRPLQAVGGWLP